MSDLNDFYRELVVQAKSLLAGEHDRIANAANLGALIYHALPQVNWAGFYFLDGDELVVGPFQGKPACVRIALGQGVCGQAAAQRATIVVPNVHEFAGHIFCDSASSSEIVVPLVDGGRLLGVLDLDSPKLARFDAADRGRYGLKRGHAWTGYKVHVTETCDDDRPHLLTQVVAVGIESSHGAVSSGPAGLRLPAHLGHGRPGSLRLTQPAGAAALVAHRRARLAEQHTRNAVGGLPVSDSLEHDASLPENHIDVCRWAH